MDRQCPYCNTNVSADEIECPQCKLALDPSRIAPLPKLRPKGRTKTATSAEKETPPAPARVTPPELAPVPAASAAVAANPPSTLHDEIAPTTKVTPPPPTPVPSPRKKPAPVTPVRTERPPKVETPSRTAPSVPAPAPAPDSPPQSQPAEGRLKNWMQKVLGGRPDSPDALIASAPTLPPVPDSAPAPAGTSRSRSREQDKAPSHQGPALSANDAGTRNMPGADLDHVILPSSLYSLQLRDKDGQWRHWANIGVRGLTIGRSTIHSSFPFLNSMADRHLQLAYEENRVIASDLGSVNGVFLRIETPWRSQTARSFAWGAKSPYSAAPGRSARRRRFAPNRAKNS